MKLKIRHVTAAIIVSAGIHLAVAGYFAPAEPETKVAGGAAVDMLILGNAFDDAVQSGEPSDDIDPAEQTETSEIEPVETVEEPVETAELTPVEPKELIEEPQTEDAIESVEPDAVEAAEPTEVEAVEPTEVSPPIRWKPPPSLRRANLPRCPTCRCRRPRPSVRRCRRRSKRHRPRPSP